MIEEKLGITEHLALELLSDLEQELINNELQKDRCVIAVAICVYGRHSDILRSKINSYTEMANDVTNGLFSKEIARLIMETSH